jgi:hypothetical protein
MARVAVSSEWGRQTHEDGIRLETTNELAPQRPAAGGAAGPYVGHRHGQATKVPSVLIPRVLESRLKPLRFENRRLRETLGWTPPLNYQHCLARAYVENCARQGLQAGKVRRICLGSISAALARPSSRIRR